jgi:hypothetical protein
LYKHVYHGGGGYPAIFGGAVGNRTKHCHDLDNNLPGLCCSRLDNSVASEDCLLKCQNSFASLEHLCYDGLVKLLPAALQKQDYNLAAHVLVYGLVKASVKTPKNSLNFRGPQQCYGSRKKKPEKE